METAYHHQQDESAMVTSLTHNGLRRVRSGSVHPAREGACEPVSRRFTARCEGEQPPFMANSGDYRAIQGGSSRPRLQHSAQDHGGDVHALDPLRPRPPAGRPVRDSRGQCRSAARPSCRREEDRVEIRKAVQVKAAVPAGLGARVLSSVPFPQGKPCESLRRVKCYEARTFIGRNARSTYPLLHHVGSEKGLWLMYLLVIRPAMKTSLNSCGATWSRNN